MQVFGIMALEGERLKTFFFFKFHVYCVLVAVKREHRWQ